MATVTRKIGLSLGADLCWPAAYEHLVKKLDLAIKEYYKVVHLHGVYPAIGAEAIFKAALCHAELGDKPSAIRDLTDLIAKFPESAMVPMAKAELGKLGGQ